MSAERFLNRQPFRIMRTLAETIKALTFFGAAAVSGAGIILFGMKRISDSHTLAAILFTALTLCLVAQGYTWTFFLRSYDPRFYEILELHGNLRIEPSKNHHHYEYTRTKLIRPKRDNLRLIEFRDYWTGAGHKGSTKVRSLHHEHTLLDGHTEEEDQRVYRWIYLRRPLRRGEIIDVGMVQTHEDDVTPQRPFFRQQGGRHSTRRIVVTTEFQLSDDPVKIVGTHWNDSRAFHQKNIIGSIDHKREVCHEKGTVIYRIEIDRPKPYHSYGLWWTWASRTQASGTHPPMQA